MWLRFIDASMAGTHTMEWTITTAGGQWTTRSLGIAKGETGSNVVMGELDAIVDEMKIIVDEVDIGVGQV